VLISRLEGLQSDISNKFAAGHPYLGCSCLAGCVHSSVNKPGTNGGVTVSYDLLTHSRLYCRDRQKREGSKSSSSSFEFEFELA